MIDDIINNLQCKGINVEKTLSRYEMLNKLFVPQVPLKPIIIPNDCFENKEKELNKYL